LRKFRDRVSFSSRVDSNLSRLFSSPPLPPTIPAHRLLDIPRRMLVPRTNRKRSQAILLTPSPSQIELEVEVGVIVVERKPTRPLRSSACPSSLERRGGQRTRSYHRPSFTFIFQEALVPGFCEERELSLPVFLCAQAQVDASSF